MEVDGREQRLKPASLSKEKGQTIAAPWWIYIHTAQILPSDQGKRKTEENRGILQRSIAK